MLLEFNLGKVPICEVCLNNKIYKYNQGLSDDQTQCLTCPRYCSFCIEQSEVQINKLNPNFIYEDSIFKRYIQKCVKCLTADELCDREQAKEGLGYKCLSEANKEVIVLSIK
ncbi:hypothetical protein IMG5_004640 [Ichthyophthirius multifiliis]|uniref:Uncharacterized protein n=1 Tax=Ichthyophthirius multifiliis TaxID=5932 RepID=G0QJE9_ICHMU|nr:hypothetical protein IMG5_004640 [Ichthyophthirius multifiliis]EGR34661.1 hypothetical protein IMG5_004640 [Ichthyophthirius multifiliis]|eukprot:XP_004039965.1 hypothetical protein IMG5_004640 [Ichthyophthirius multifiliis]